MMASSNPFRRKSAIITTTKERAESSFPPLNAIDTSVATPSSTSFQYNQQLPDGPATDGKIKVVKQVRILSPPPLSPDSPEWAFAVPPLGIHSGQLNNENDPFEAASSDDSDREITSTGPRSQNNSRIPPNPFSKTLKDVESVEGERELEDQRKGEGLALKAGNIARRSLDVNAFKRLLMTGNSGTGSSPTPYEGSRLKLGHQRSATETFSGGSGSPYTSSKDVRQPTSQIHDTSLISNEVPDALSDEADEGSISDSSVSAQLSTGKKPPPPPSSRHGKAIRLELKDEGQFSELPRSKSPSDINKPLPPAPVRKSFEDPESPFDRESAGKVPEIDTSAPTPITWGGKKAGPAPPPRRGHSRGESKANAASILGVGQNATQSHDDGPPPRSSMESTKSRSERSRAEGYVPAPPPPPRRSLGPSRQSSHSLPAVSAIADESASSASTPHLELERSAVSSPSPYTSSPDPIPVRDVHSGTPKPFAPPPPPARNPSVRRPASVRSIDSTSRRISAETKPHNSVAPPPPPRRQRGNSRGSHGSLDGQPPRRTSMENSAASAVPLLEEEAISGEAPERVADPATSMSPQSAVDMGKGVDILADLDALQREVDALRGKLK